MNSRSQHSRSVLRRSRMKFFGVSASPRPRVPASIFSTRVYFRLEGGSNCEGL
ncbi:MAG: hypothetical protein F6K41_26460 [Symploca sp. SIO3E6]|nr:hypothetical protein [Caldora sp. SIO3E6]